MTEGGSQCSLAIAWTRHKRLTWICCRATLTIRVTLCLVVYLYWLTVVCNLVAPKKCHHVRFERIMWENNWLVKRKIKTQWGFSPCPICLRGGGGVYGSSPCHPPGGVRGDLASLLGDVNSSIFVYSRWCEHKQFLTSMVQPASLLLFVAHTLPVRGVLSTRCCCEGSYRPLWPWNWPGSNGEWNPPKYLICAVDCWGGVTMTPSSADRSWKYCCLAHAYIHEYIHVFMYVR